jgi:hypothetical protein
MAEAISRQRSWYRRPAMWIGVVVLAAGAAAGVFEMGSRPAAIRYSDFLDQLDADNVASVSFAGTQIDGTFKQPIAQAPAKNATSVTVFRSRVPDIGDPTLFTELRANHVPFAVASSHWFGLGGATILGIIGAFLLAKPMLLLVAAAFVAGLVRVARGGKMDVRSILAVMPMFKPLSNQSERPKEPN